jgi:hypothetical protein
MPRIYLDVPHRKTNTREKQLHSGQIGEGLCSSILKGIIPASLIAQAARVQLTHPVGVRTISRIECSDTTGTRPDRAFNAHKLDNPFEVTILAVDFADL